MSFFCSQPQHNTVPTLTFIGPDARDTIYVEGPQGVRTPIFAVNISKHSKPSLSVYRITPTGHQQPFFTSSTSSMSGTSTINLQNQEIKMKVSYTSMQSQREFDGPMGKLSWFPTGLGSDHKLKDKNGLVIARFKTHISSGSQKEPRLEICVPCNDALVDLIVATGLAVYQNTVKEAKQLSTASEIIGSVLGG